MPLAIQTSRSAGRYIAVVSWVVRTVDPLARSLDDASDLFWDLVGDSERSRVGRQYQGVIDFLRWLRMLQQSGKRDPL